MSSTHSRSQWRLEAENCMMGCNAVLCIEERTFIRASVARKINDNSFSASFMTPLLLRKYFSIIRTPVSQELLQWPPVCSMIEGSREQGAVGPSEGTIVSQIQLFALWKSSRPSGSTSSQNFSRAC